MRYRSIKEEGFNAEDATDINQVTKALHQVGVQATTTDGQLRNFGDVVRELGTKWEGLDDKSRSYIATTLAGQIEPEYIAICM